MNRFLVLAMRRPVLDLAVVPHHDPAHLSGGWQLTVHEWRAK